MGKRPPPPIANRFKPGQSGNPEGARAHNKDVRRFKETTYKQFIEALQKYGSMSREQLSNDLKRPEATMFELMFGNIVAQAAKGDQQARQLLIDRLWGKLKECDININLSSLSDKELIEQAKEAIKVLSNEPLTIEGVMNEGDTNVGV